MEQWNSCENNYSKAKYYDYLVLEKRKWWYKHFRVEIVYEFFTSSSSMLLVITHLIYLLTFKYKREETNVEEGFRVFYSIKKKRGLHCFSSKFWRFYFYFLLEHKEKLRLSKTVLKNAWMMSMVDFVMKLYFQECVLKNLFFKRNALKF